MSAADDADTRQARLRQALGAIAAELLTLVRGSPPRRFHVVLHDPNHTDLRLSFRAPVGDAALPDVAAWQARLRSASAELQAARAKAEALRSLSLSVIEQAVVDALAAGPLKGDTVRERVAHGNLRALLANLVDRGVLESTPDGYRVTAAAARALAPPDSPPPPHLA
jgi:hypothetical protein